MKKFNNAAIKKACHKNMRLNQAQLNLLYDEKDIRAAKNPKTAAKKLAAKLGISIPTSVEEVLEHITLAQVASDGGKGISRFYGMNKVANTAYSRRYAAKDSHLMAAILGIESLDLFSQIQWFINSDWEEVYFHPEWADEGWPEIQAVVYFEWKGYQISFHSFNAKWGLFKQIFSVEETEWDEGSSPWTAFQMMQALNRAEFKGWGSERVLRRLQMMEEYAGVTGDDRFDGYRWWVEDNLFSIDEDNKDYDEEEYGKYEYDYQVWETWSSWRYEERKSSSIWQEEVDEYYNSLAALPKKIEAHREMRLWEKSQWLKEVKRLK